MEYQLSPGLSWQMDQNVAYALPARKCFITSGAAIEYAFLTTGPWIAMVGANTTGVHAAGSFIRCTTGMCQVVARA